MIKRVAGPPLPRYVISSYHQERTPAGITLRVMDYILVTHQLTGDRRDFYLQCHFCMSKSCEHALLVLRAYYRRSTS